MNEKELNHNRLISQIDAIIKEYIEDKLPDTSRRVAPTPTFTEKLEKQIKRANEGQNNEALGIVREIFRPMKQEAMFKVRELFVDLDEEDFTRSEYISHFIRVVDGKLLPKHLRYLKSNFFKKIDLSKWKHLVKTPPGELNLSEAEGDLKNQVEKEIIQYLVNMCHSMDIKDRRTDYQMFLADQELLLGVSLEKTARMVVANAYISPDSSFKQFSKQFILNSVTKGSKSLEEKGKGLIAAAMSSLMALLGTLFYEFRHGDFSAILSVNTLYWVLSILGVVYLGKQVIQLIAEEVPKLYHKHKSDTLLTLLKNNNAIVQEKIKNSELLIRRFIKVSDPVRKNIKKRLKLIEELDSSIAQLFGGSEALEKQGKRNRMLISMYILSKSKILEKLLRKSKQKNQERSMSGYAFVTGILLVFLIFFGIKGYLREDPVNLILTEILAIYTMFLLTLGRLLKYYYIFRG